MEEEPMIEHRNQSSVKNYPLSTLITQMSLLVM